MGFFDKVKKAFKGAADAGKETAGDVGAFTVDVADRTATFTEEVAQTAANAVAKGADATTDKAGDALKPNNAPRKI